MMGWQTATSFNLKKAAMNLKVYFSEFHYKKHYSFLERLLYFVLLPFSEVYKYIALLRNYLYKSNVLKSYKSSARVISIGNITTGGTGKTPIVFEFASYLAVNTDNKVAILSRGYGKKDKSAISVVKTNNNILINDPKECGDEALMLANMLDNVVILTGSNRKKLAKLAVDEYNCNLLILDDGLQHKALARDLDIALIDQQNVLGNKKQLPLGPLREPVSSLRYVDSIIWVNKSGVNTTDGMNIKNLFNISVPEYYAEYKVVGFVKYPNKQMISDITEKEVLAFTGIGQPESFFKQLQNQNMKVMKTLIFPDHNDYTESDINIINNESRNKGIKAIVTTEKDIIKLLNYLNAFELPVYILKMKMEINIKGLLGDLNF